MAKDKAEFEKRQGSLEAQMERQIAQMVIKVESCVS